MTQIRKYPLTRNSLEIALEPNFQVLSAGFDGQDQICIWGHPGEHDSNHAYERLHYFEAVNTGMDRPDGCEFLATLKLPGGAIIWHVFYRVSENVQLRGTSAGKP